MDDEPGRLLLLPLLLGLCVPTVRTLALLPCLAPGDLPRDTPVPAVDGRVWDGRGMESACTLGLEMG